MWDIEKTVTASQLSAGCADLYIDFTRDWILKPAGAFATRTRAPQNPKSLNFAYLYNWNDHSTQGLMPDRRLNIGSGGWAMSAKEYGKFLSALFDEELLSANIKVGNSWFNTIDYMKANNLGMFPAWGSTNEEYYQHRGANTYTTNSGEYGGQSVWMHFPSTNMCAVVQINCNANEVGAAGIGRETVLEEAHDVAMMSPTPAGLAHEFNFFTSRKDDGTTIGRGVFANGNLASRNFDMKAEENWALTRFFETPQQTFMLRYNPDNRQDRGTLQVRKVNPDGTLGAVTFTSDNWTKNWSHLEVFHKSSGDDTYLLCYRKSDGRFRTYAIENHGVVVGPAITDTTASANFDIVQVVKLNGNDHLFRHNSSSGHTHVRQLDPDGSWGSTVYDKIWNSGWLSFNFYTTGTGDTFILRYNWNNGNANILKFDSTVAGLDNTSVVLNAQWSENWRIMRFFRTSAGTFNFRYNPENGWMRIQSIRDNGTFDDVVTSSNGGWLRERSADGPFRPATSGWDTAEFYIARDVVIDPIPPREVQSLPNPQGNSSDLIVEIPPVTRPDLVKLEAPTPTTRFVRGQIQLNWVGSRDVLYFIEKSEDLSNWSPAGLLEGNGEPLQWSRQLLEEDPNNTEEFLPKFFYRIRTIEGAPEEPIVGQPGARD